MSAAPKGQLVLTIDEFQWLLRTVERKLRVLPDVKNKRLRSAVNALYRKLEELSTNLPERLNDPIILPTSRIELRILQEWVKVSHASLVGPITQNYMERMSVDPVHFGKALEGVTEMSKMLERVLNKIGKVI